MEISEVGFLREIIVIRSAEIRAIYLNPTTLFQLLEENSGIPGGDPGPLRQCRLLRITSRMSVEIPEDGVETNRLE